MQLFPQVKTRGETVRTQVVSGGVVQHFENLVRELPQDEVGRELFKRCGKQTCLHLKEAIDRHHYMRDRDNFEEKYKYTLWALVLLEAQSQGASTDMTYSELGQSLGIQMNRRYNDISIHQKSGRVSALWETCTSTQNDALRWAIIAPPSSGYKRRNVLKWLTGNLDTTERVREEIKLKGLLD